MMLFYVIFLVSFVFIILKDLLRLVGVNKIFVSFNLFFILINILYDETCFLDGNNKKQEIFSIIIFSLTGH